MSFAGENNSLIDYLKVVTYSQYVRYNSFYNFYEISKNDISRLSEELKCKLVVTSKELKEIGTTMKLQPYVYQKESIRFILDKNKALLILPCGAGKTPTGIGAYVEAIKRKLIEGKGLIVVKASLKNQWVTEVSKFSDCKAKAIESPAALSSKLRSKINKNNKIIDTLDKIKDCKKIKSLHKENAELENTILENFRKQFEGYDLYVVNYEALIDSTVREELKSMDINFIFADEIHMIGSKDSQRSMALQEFDAKIKVGATATPITNNPSNIYSIFKFIDPNLFPSWSKFSNEFIKWAGRGRIAGGKNKGKMSNMISPYLMIKSKEEISDQLPKLQVIQRFVTLENKQLDANSKIMDELDKLKEEDFKIRSKCKNEYEAKNNIALQKVGAQVLALQTFSQEIADDPRLLEQSDSEFAKKYAFKIKENPKMEALMDIVKEVIESGEKVAIFSKFERMQGLITERILKYDNSIKIAYVNGSISSTQRNEEVYAKFRDNDEYKVLLLSDAGAEGLNLSKCKYLIEYDLANSYAIQTQRHGRLERADSIHSNVTVYQLIARESWDEIALKIIDKKENYDLEIIKSLIKN